MQHQLHQISKEMNGLNAYQIAAFKELRGKGLTANQLRQWGGKYFGASHKKALVNLMTAQGENNLSAEAALVVLESMDVDQVTRFVADPKSMAPFSVSQCVAMLLQFGKFAPGASSVAPNQASSAPAAGSVAESEPAAEPAAKSARLS